MKLPHLCQITIETLAVSKNPAQKLLIDFIIGPALKHWQKLFEELCDNHLFVMHHKDPLSAQSLYFNVIERQSELKMRLALHSHAARLSGLVRMGAERAASFT